ncbi:MAG: hypothetical protein PWP08_1233, partial [Methanofollis sp.]|nr:hypothetical protein [Methanofollis sp.]
NEETLRTLVNGTQRFDEIKQLQIEYRDKDDPSKLYSIIYEGEALQDELAQACTTYAGQEKVMSSIARKYDQNTTAYEESVDRYQEIVGEVAEVQQHEIGASAPALPPPAISIFLTPEEARYGEEIQVRGRLDTGKDGADTALYVDSRRYANTGTAGGGRYAFVYTVEKSRAGTHLVYVQSGRSVSDLAPFSVLSSPSALTLTAKANASAQTAVCTGTLTAAGRGVAGAEVTICADGNAAASTRTAENGAYETAIALEPGRHTLRAAFDAAGFPLEPSESDDAEVAITDPLGLMKAALTGLAAVAVGLIAGLIYLRRSQRPPAPKEAVETVAEPPPLPEPEPPGPAGPLTPIEEAVLLRERLALEAGKHCGLKNPRAKTPREIAAAFEGTAAEESARAFVRLYEAVRYAGMPCGDEEVGELRRLYGAAVGAL